MVTLGGVFNKRSYVPNLVTLIPVITLDVMGDIVPIFIGLGT